MHAIWVLLTYPCLLLLVCYGSSLLQFFLYYVPAMVIALFSFIVDASTCVMPCLTTAFTWCATKRVYKWKLGGSFGSLPMVSKLAIFFLTLLSCIHWTTAMDPTSLNSAASSAPVLLGPAALGAAIGLATAALKRKTSDDASYSGSEDDDDVQPSNIRSQFESDCKAILKVSS